MITPCKEVVEQDIDVSLRPHRGGDDDPYGGDGSECASVNAKNHLEKWVRHSICEVEEG